MVYPILEIEEWWSKLDRNDKKNMLEEEGHWSWNLLQHIHKHLMYVKYRGIYKEKQVEKKKPKRGRKSKRRSDVNGSEEISRKYGNDSISA